MPARSAAWALLKHIAAFAGRLKKRVVCHRYLHIRGWGYCNSQARCRGGYALSCKRTVERCRRCMRRRTDTAICSIEHETNIVATIECRRLRQTKAVLRKQRRQYELQVEVELSRATRQWAARLPWTQTDGDAQCKLRWMRRRSNQRRLVAGYAAQRLKNRTSARAKRHQGAARQHHDSPDLCTMAVGF